MAMRCSTEARLPPVSPPPRRPGSRLQGGYVNCAYRVCTIQLRVLLANVLVRGLSEKDRRADKCTYPVCALYIPSREARPNRPDSARRTLGRPTGHAPLRATATQAVAPTRCQETSLNHVPRMRRSSASE